MTDLSPPSDFSIENIVVRPACLDDVASLRELFQRGMLAGNVPKNDTGADIENLKQAYFDDDDESGFWVAQFDELVIGMIGVQKISEDQAEIRRMRVREAYRRQGVGRKLLETALTFCQGHGYLKIVLDVAIERAPALALFDSFGFQHGRTREINGRTLQDFYLNIYKNDSGG